MPHPGRHGQINFYPYIQHEISVLIEFIIGHLRYHVTDVPPQPNSPSIGFFVCSRPKTFSLRRQQAASKFEQMSGTVISVVVFQRWQASHLLYTRNTISHDRLESSSTGSSFPAETPKPVPLAVVSLESR